MLPSCSWGLHALRKPVHPAVMAGVANAFAHSDASKENMEPHVAPEYVGSGLEKMFREGADAIGTHKCAPACPRLAYKRSARHLLSASARSTLLVHSDASRSPS